jgi:hypothetical protein
MSKNLNKMSIKDYFKHLYDEIMAKKKKSQEVEEEDCIILRRLQNLILNNNKSIGAYEDQNYDLDIIFGNNFIQFFLLFHHLFF